MARLMPRGWTGPKPSYRHPLRSTGFLGRLLWRRLQWRLFVAYIVILIVTVSVQTISADFFASLSIRGYVHAHQHGIDPNEIVVQAVLAFTISLFLVTAVSVIAATGASLFVAQRIVEPLQSMAETSQRIAHGRYSDRIPVSDDYEISDLAISLNSMAETLEKTELQRQELIGNVAHELRTPLTTIKGYMEGLIDGVVPANAATFTLIHDEADRLSRLVSDLQDLSRLEESNGDLHPRVMQLTDIVASVVQKMRPQADRKGISLTTTIEGASSPYVLADYDRMQQVLLNLVANALQYTAEGGAVRIDIVPDPTAGVVRLSVVDDGEGILPEHLPNVFTRFYRVDKSRSRAAGGSGIGLTIARRLIEAHGGTIEATSTPGKGSIFTITLPRVDDTQTRYDDAPGQTPPKSNEAEKTPYSRRQ